MKILISLNVIFFLITVQMKEFIVTMANIIEYGTFFFPHRHETLEK